MSPTSTTRLHALIESVRRGNTDARNELVLCTYERLRQMAHHMLQCSFPTLRNLHSTGTILHESLLRIIEQLEKFEPESLVHFHRFSALKMRRLLLDLARKRKILHLPEGQADTTNAEIDEQAYTTSDPAKLAMWTEFQEKVTTLPDDESELVGLLFYKGCTQAETAKFLELHINTVHKRWTRVRLKMAEWVGVTPATDEGKPR